MGKSAAHAAVRHAYSTSATSDPAIAPNLHSAMALDLGIHSPEAHLARAITDYNANRVHSSIEWRPPDEFFRLRERNNREESGQA